MLLLTPLYTSAARSTLSLATPRDLEEEDNPKRKLTRLDNRFVLHGGLYPHASRPLYAITLPYLTYQSRLLSTSLPPRHGDEAIHPEKTTRIHQA